MYIVIKIDKNSFTEYFWFIQYREEVVLIRSLVETSGKKTHQMQNKSNTVFQMIKKKQYVFVNGTLYIFSQLSKS